MASIRRHRRFRPMRLWARKSATQSDAAAAPYRKTFRQLSISRPLRSALNQPHRAWIWMTATPPVCSARRRKTHDEQAKTRTHLDRQEQAAEVGATNSAGGAGAVVSCGAAGG